MYKNRKCSSDGSYGRKKQQTELRTDGTDCAWCNQTLLQVLFWLLSVTMYTNLEFPPKVIMQHLSSQDYLLGYPNSVKNASL